MRAALGWFGSDWIAAAPSRLGCVAGGGGRGLCRCGAGAGAAGAGPQAFGSGIGDRAGLWRDPPTAHPRCLAGSVGQGAGREATAQAALAVACGALSTAVDGADSRFSSGEHRRGVGQSQQGIGPAGPCGEWGSAGGAAGAGGRRNPAIAQRFAGSARPGPFPAGLVHPVVDRVARGGGGRGGGQRLQPRAGSGFAGEPVAIEPCAGAAGSGRGWHQQ